MAEQLTQEQIAAYAETWADALCECAGEDKTFAEQFKKDLFSSKENFMPDSSKVSIPILPTTNPLLAGIIEWIHQ